VGKQAIYIFFFNIDLLKVILSSLIIINCFLVLVDVKVKVKLDIGFEMGGAYFTHLAETMPPPASPTLL